MTDEQERLFQDLVHVHRLEMRFGRPREAEQLVDQRIDPIDLVPDQV
jgi:hypothetical protein